MTWDVEALELSCHLTGFIDWLAEYAGEDPINLQSPHIRDDLVNNYVDFFMAGKSLMEEQ